MLQMYLNDCGDKNELRWKIFEMRNLKNRTGEEALRVEKEEKRIGRKANKES